VAAADDYGVVATRGDAHECVPGNIRFTARLPIGGSGAGVRVAMTQMGRRHGV
jgi:hypothetical protein